MMLPLTLIKRNPDYDLLFKRIHGSGIVFQSRRGAKYAFNQNITLSWNSTYSHTVAETP